MFDQITLLPSILQIKSGVIRDVRSILVSHEVPIRKILVVSGQNVSAKYAENVLQQLDGLHEISVVASIAEESRLVSVCENENPDILIGIGGGTVLDLVKRVSLLSDTPNILVPTVISNDGLMSPIAVIKDSFGVSHSLPGRMPVGIIVDIDIIKEAPLHFLQAAAGDLLSNISSTNDWSIACKHGKETMNDLAYMLSRSVALSLMNHASKDLRNDSFISQIIYGQIYSGLAMYLAGTSRPCSGSEHLISHAIDYMGLSTNTLHGLQVGSISIFTLFLQKQLNAKCLDYAAELDMPYAFHLLNDNLYGQMKDIYENALLMRPGRFTILDLCGTTPFDDLYNNFVVFLERFNN